MGVSRNVVLPYVFLSSKSRDHSAGEKDMAATSKLAFAAFYDTQLIAFGFDEPSQLVALVTGIGEYRFNRRKHWP
jgi:hypothetical protein